jgi:hypothetical protein
MLKKKVSSKINYSVLENLFSFDKKMFDPQNTSIEEVKQTDGEQRPEFNHPTDDEAEPDDGDDD